ncbi:Cell cycle checkpoint protein RAD1 [Trachymyrmex septentrionalis]|uniref:Cell cycle checkpoint protein RAD1 n=1 Tax=Trachymyrmex septentrionalis TaxID=34720 RepID=A0A195F2K8_9HYME|nr:Cell cycle checkpoint protein RAD1 [Trachymyrmex septentrionalis]
MNSYQQVINTGSQPPTVYDQKYVDFVDNILKEVADDFEREKKFSDQNLLKLHKLFDGVFERALDLYEQQRVTQISTSNTIITESCKSANEAIWLMQVKGHSGALYTLFPEINYCTCAAFRHQVLTDRSAFTCKHVLATWLASIDIEKLLHQQLTQKQFQTNMTPSNIEDYVLLAKVGLKNLEIIIELLKAINFKEIATCLGSENGLKITVEDAKCIQASAYIPSTVFDEFELKEDVTFSLNLNILVDCLCMFWPTSQEDSVTMQIFYKGTGYPLTIIIEENGIITDCSLKTLEVKELLDFHLDTENVVNKVVLQTKLLKSIMAELDPTSRLLELHLSPEEPFFRISLQGIGSVCDIDLPHDDDDLIDTFQCTKTVTSTFKLEHIILAMKALSCANKISLRTNDAGLLCFQYMIKTEDGNTCYMEYYVRFFIIEQSNINNQIIIVILIYFNSVKNVSSIISLSYISTRVTISLYIQSNISVIYPDMSKRHLLVGIIPVPVSHGINTYRQTDQWIFIGTVSELGTVELCVLNFISVFLKALDVFRVYTPSFSVNSTTGLTLLPILRVTIPTPERRA